MFKNRIRLPFILTKPQFPVEKNVFRKADGSSHIISAVVRNTYEGKTDYLTADWHKKLVIALMHKEVTVEGTHFLSDVVIDGDYGIDWNDFLYNPVAPANFTVQVTPFNASTSNCQSCSEITQLSLVDDYTDEIWDEGTTHEFPDVVTANDTICCYPYVISLISFNTDYFDSVTVDANGVLTAVVAASVPILNNVLIATYRVTCENGGYDEANVYGNINGTDPGCVPPSGLLPVLDPDNGTIASVVWDEPSPAPSGGYDWALYSCDDIYTVLDSGNVSGDSVDFTGLLPNTCYIVAVASVCGEGDLSVYQTIEFTTSATGGEDCGLFIITFFGTFGYCDFVSCGGYVEHIDFTTSGQTMRCILLQPGTTTPVLFQASAGVSILYHSTCG